MTLRRMRDEDAPALWGVFHAAVHISGRGHYDAAQLAAWAPDVPDPERWAARLSALRPWVVEIDGVPVGYGDLQPDGLIDHLFVHPRRQRQGVGSRLVARLREDARRRRLENLHTHASRMARPFFEAQGFRVVERREVVVNGMALENFLMTCALGGRG